VQVEHREAAFLRFVIGRRKVDQDIAIALQKTGMKERMEPNVAGQCSSILTESKPFIVANGD
jgi:hypothetical protein